jgi:hypothetical protein
MSKPPTTRMPAPPAVSSSMSAPVKGRPPPEVVDNAVVLAVAPDPVDDPDDPDEDVPPDPDDPDPPDDFVIGGSVPVEPPPPPPVCVPPPPPPPPPPPV